MVVGRARGAWNAFELLATRFMHRPVGSLIFDRAVLGLDASGASLMRFFVVHDAISNAYLSHYLSDIESAVCISFAWTLHLYKLSVLIV